ncbi:MAG: hypothetical protein GQ574_14110 [Crocinitomix sp.]|nr:hypothetical protein [Crocinitomix sp.]
MEILYYSSAFCLILFAVLATFDGIYLHIWKFELFKHEDSTFEHKTHSVRAVLFPLIVWFLFIQHDPISFWIGIALVFLDLLVLAIDAWSEKDSRQAMGGLPRWEYIIHLFSNGFHFAAIGIVVAIRLILNSEGIELTVETQAAGALEFLIFIAFNLIPGAIIFALLHVLLTTQYGVNLWNKNRKRVKCC